MEWSAGWVSHDSGTRLVRSLAEKGFSVNGVTLSSDESFAVFDEAVAGNAPAQYIIGSVLQQENLEAQAFEWFRRSALQGHEPARAVLRKLSDRAA